MISPVVISRSRDLRPRAAGFTLIELLVAFAVLIVLVSILASVFSNFAQITSSSNRRLDSGRQVRAVFDRLGFDLNSAVKNGGVNIQFLKNQSASPTGQADVNDAIVMLADARSTDATSRLARIGYDVRDVQSQSRNTMQPSLMRHVEPFMWDDDVVKDIALTSSATTQTLAPGILRFELAFLREDGEIVAAPPPADQIKAVICAVATLDEESMGRVQQSDIDALIGALPDAVDGNPPLAQWDIQGSALQNVPQSIAENVRFYQRYFYLK